MRGGDTQSALAFDEPNLKYFLGLLLRSFVVSQTGFSEVWVSIYFNSRP